MTHYKNGFYNISNVASNGQPAPDGLLIKEIAPISEGGIAQFTINPGFTGKAVQHQTITEVWFLTSGENVEVWISNTNNNQPLALQSGDYFVVLPHTPFQVKNSTAAPVTFLALTMPPYPGDHEVLPASGFWN